MKRTFYNVLPVFSIIILLSLISCKQKEEQQRQNFISSEAPDLTKEELKTVHKDTNYKYEYRTGKSGDYEYNYDVSGTDNEGNKVSGTVYVNGKYGNGTINNANGEGVEVETEWIGKGVMKAKDSQGNEYKLEVD